MKMGLELKELQLNHLYQEVLSNRVVLIVELKESTTGMLTGCYGLVYNKVTGVVDKVQIHNNQLIKLTTNSVSEILE